MATQDLIVPENLSPVGMPSAHEMQVFQTLARSAVKSPLYRHLDECTALMIILAARELNIPPMLALNGGIHAIQGKIEISARLMTSLIRRAGHSITFVQHDDKICVLRGTRADTGDKCEVSFSWDEAVKAGLTKNPTWNKYPGDMLYCRAISRLARRLYADVIGNAYVEGEISNIVPVEIQEKETIPPEKMENMLEEFLAPYPEEERVSKRKFIMEKAEKSKKTIVEVIERAKANLESFNAAASNWLAAT